MKKLIPSLLLLSVFTVGNVSLALAQTGHEEHHPPAATAPAQPMGQGGMTGGMPCAPGMMAGMPGMGMGQMGGMMCPMCGMMMGGGMAGMEGMPMGRMMGGGMGRMGAEAMMARMDRPFFLDRVKELGLSDAQVAKLRSIRQAARADHLRTSAELKISRLELHELVAGEWTAETAEKLVRNAQKLQGDMKVRFLKAMKEAEKVLTPEQLKMGRGGEVELEGLFR